MNLKEKVAYLKGLSDGLKLDEKKDEIKIINAIMDLLSDMAEQITDTNDKVDGLAYTVESIDDELSDLEEAVYDDEDDDDDEDKDYEEYYHGHHHHHCCDDDGCCHDEDEDVLYEVTCPTCGEKLTVEEEELLCGETECPNCGEFLEFDFSFLSDDDEDEKESENKTTDETIEKEDTEE